MEVPTNKPLAGSESNLSDHGEASIESAVLKCSINDVVRFSICSLSTIKLAQLYPESSHE